MNTSSDRDTDVLIARSESEAAQTQPAKGDYGNRKGDRSHIHSGLPMPGQTRSENIDVNESGRVVRKEGAEGRKQQP